MSEEAGSSMADDGQTNITDPQASQDTKFWSSKSAYDESVETRVRERLAREKAKYADYDELRAKAERFDELQQANQSEIEKAIARAEKAEQEKASLEQRWRDASLRAAIVAEAAKPGRQIADPEAAVVFLTGPDADLLAVGDDGSPTNIAEAMDQLLEKRSFLNAVSPGGARGNADQGARGSTGHITRDQLKNMSSAEIVAAQNAGQLDHLLGTSS